MKRGAAMIASVALATACGGKKSDSHAGSSPAEVDALWALAPTGADTGVVVSANAMSSAEAALARIEELGKDSPELAARVADLEAQMGAAIHAPTLRRWADVGLAARGLALFRAGEGALIVLPVADRAKFLAAVGGHAGAGAGADHIADLTCRMIGEHYLCSDRAALLDAPRAEPAGRHAAKLRGDVEAWVSRERLTQGKAEVTGDLELAAEIAPGRITIRAHVPVRLPAELAMVAKAARVKAPGADRASGLLIANLAPLIAQLPPGGGVVPDALRAFAGPITMVAKPGTLDLDVRAGIKDASAVAALLRQCDQIVPPGSGIVATPAPTPAGDGCHVSVAAPIAPGQPGFDFDAWIDGDTLRASRDRKTPVVAKTDVAPTAIGAELGDGSWTFAAWGRGAMIHNLMAGTGGDAVDAVPFALVTEFGIGVRAGDDGFDGLLHVRTIYDNPADVIAALAPVIAKTARGEAIDADVTAVAAKFPSSPYAADVRAGEGGLLVPVATIGMMSAIAIPFFMDYLDVGPTKGSDVDLDLFALTENAKQHYQHDGAFPIGTVGPTPPTSCCGGPGNLCAPAPTDWTDPVWAALDFRKTSAPFRFQYSYQGTATEFTATATADLDCDPTNGSTTITAHGRVENGEPVVQITRVDEH